MLKYAVLIIMITVPQTEEKTRWILCHQHRFLYAPIPKVACTSLKLWIAGLLSINISTGVHQTKFPFIKPRQARSYPDYFTFCFIRNPWDRLLSCYRNKIKEPSFNERGFKNGVAPGLLKFKVFQPEMSFDDFVGTVSEIPDDAADKHFRSQYRFIINESGSVDFDFMGRFEFLKRDFEKICAQIGIPNNSLRHEVKSDHQHYQSYYSASSRRLAGKRYQEDIELLDYQF